MKYQFDPIELTSEKSLWDVYVLSRRIRPSWVQTLLNLAATGLLTVNAFVLQPNTTALLADARSWATNGFNFTITTLGFLIAGFTIFMTVAKPAMMLAMMDHQDKETALPTLKKNIFAFMRVFIAYLTCAGLYLFVILFCQTGGVISYIVKLIPASLGVRDLMIQLGYVLLGSSFVYLLLMLKSFIFNVYAIVMNFLRWEHSNAE
ncbi:MAG: hypothetical protein HZA63_09390 [Rhodocyclales bacterium]|nr:hypothetical protein [Rhodocyclales bacterium]